MKLKNFCIVKETINEMKKTEKGRKPSMKMKKAKDWTGEKIFANHIFYVLYLKYIKSVYNSILKQNNLI